MNPHEADRIAAAINHLRPDWPVRQLRSLLDHAGLKDRPRRDVTVALAWVACESATASPYRVIEAGPWWKAAGVEGGSSNRDNPPAHERCSICSLSAARCRQVWSADHDFEPATAQHKRDPEAMAQIVEAIKGEAATADLTPAPTPTRTHEPDPRVERLRQLARPEGDA